MAKAAEQTIYVNPSNEERADVSIKVYDAHNSGDILTPTKITEITSLLRKAYSSPMWDANDEEDDEAFRKRELEFTLRSGGGAAIAESEDGKIVGYRLFIGFNAIIEAAKIEPLLVPLVEKISSSIEGSYETRELNLTIEMGTTTVNGKNGIGSKLIPAHVEWAQQNGFRALSGWTPNANTKMTHLYGKFGYIPMKCVLNEKYGIEYSPHMTPNGEAMFGIVNYSSGEEENWKGIGYWHMPL